MTVLVQSFRSPRFRREIFFPRHLLCRRCKLPLLSTEQGHLIGCATCRKHSAPKEQS